MIRTAEIATAALQAGYNVVLDKPMTRTLDEAIALSECVANATLEKFLG